MKKLFFILFFAPLVGYSQYSEEYFEKNQQEQFKTDDNYTLFYSRTVGNIKTWLTFSTSKNGSLISINGTGLDSPFSNLIKNYIYLDQHKMHAMLFEVMKKEHVVIFDEKFSNCVLIDASNSSFLNQPILLSQVIEGQQQKSSTFNLEGLAPLLKLFLPF